MEAEVFDSCLALRQIKATLHIDQTSLRPWTRKDMLPGVWQSFQHRTDRLIDRNETVFTVLGDSNVNHPSRQVKFLTREAISWRAFGLSQARLPS
jgi:hypothetical protein